MTRLMRQKGANHAPGSMLRGAQATDVLTTQELMGRLGRTAATGASTGPHPLAPSRLLAALAWRLALGLRRAEATTLPYTAEGRANERPAPRRNLVRVIFARPWLLRLASKSLCPVALERLRRFPAFRGSDYCALHTEVTDRGMDGGFHALFIGAWRGWQMFHPERLAAALGQAAGHDAAGAAATPAPWPAAVRVGVYVSTQGNVFMRELAEDLVAMLASAGVAGDLLDETADPASHEGARVVVAPHEFFLLGRGRSWLRQAVLSDAVMLNTEQAQTSWFARALPLLLNARGVIDLCAQTAALLEQAGVPSLHVILPPAPGSWMPRASDRRHPLFRTLPRAAQADAQPATAFAERPIDIAFFGTASPPRQAFLARQAAFLAQHRCVLFSRPAHAEPIRPGSADGALTRIARHVGGHARITLNLHRDVFGYFEAHRIVRQAMSMGSVVVSEPCLPHPFLRAGEHYLEAPARQMPELLEWLLHTPDGHREAARVQAAAQQALATSLDPARAAARVLALLGQAPARP
jgi:hypothetical protein